jgi:hypothetical protein
LSTEAADMVRTLAEEILLDTDFSLERPVTCEGLSFVPIVQKESSEQDMEYMNAAEAIEKGLLKLIEMGDAVNTIMAHNIGKIPILIEEAEVLSAAGSQDRIVVSSVLLQPSERKRIAVKCVHAPHGLFRGSGLRTVGAASYGLRETIRFQKYRAVMTDVEHYAPETAVDQSVVWDRVKEYCKSAGTPDPDKYVEALDALRKKAKGDSKEVQEALPNRTSGLIILDAIGELISFEFYRNHKAFSKRLGFIESVLMEYGKEKARTLEEEAAFAKAVQILMQLKEINPNEVVSHDASESIHVGTSYLKGEAVTGKKRKKSSILYCSFGK